MRMELLERYESVLELYEIKPNFIEEMGKVAKVYTDKGVYALKKIEDNNVPRNHLLRTIQTLNQNGVRSMLPLCYTKDGRYLVYENDNCYYLMPWLENVEEKDEQNSQHHHMLRALATMHGKTQREEEIKEEDVEKHYELITRKWDEDKELFERFIDRCEKKWYMSPFELYYCSYYHQTMRAREFAITQLEEWYESMKEKEKARIVLTHGNVSIQHFLRDRNSNGFFISLERSKEASPIQDLILFYSRSLNTYPLARPDRFEWLMEYEKYFPLQREEKKLMLSYMAYPHQMAKKVTAYEKGERSNSELLSVDELQRTSWLMNNMEYFVTQVNQDFQSKEYAAQQAAQTAPP